MMITSDKEDDPKVRSTRTESRSLGRLGSHSD